MSTVECVKFALDNIRQARQIKSAGLTLDVEHDVLMATWGYCQIWLKRIGLEPNVPSGSIGTIDDRQRAWVADLFDVLNRLEPELERLLAALTPPRESGKLPPP